MKKSSQPRRKPRIILAMESLGRSCRPCEIRDELEAMGHLTASSTVGSELARLCRAGRVERVFSGQLVFVERDGRQYTDTQTIALYDLTDKEGGPLDGPRQARRPYPHARPPVLSKASDQHPTDTPSDEVF